MQTKSIFDDSSYEKEVYLKFQAGPGKIAWTALHSDDAYLQEVLKDNHGKQVVCLCNKDNPQNLTIRKRGARYHLARYPDTAHLHRATCDLYSEPNTLSGRQGYEDGVVQHDLDGNTRLKLDFSLKRVSKATGSPLWTWKDFSSKQYQQPGKTVSLLGLLHEIWDQAGFNRWHPNMAGKRQYWQLYKYVSQVCEQLSGSNRALKDVIYMPAPFNRDKIVLLNKERDDFFKRFTGKSASTQRLLAVGEVKTIASHHEGLRIQLRHDLRPYYLDAALKEDTERRFMRELNATFHNTASPLGKLMAIMLVEPTKNLHASVVGIGLMWVSEDYIPMDSRYESMVIEKLIAEKRVFKKPMRFDARQMHVFPDFLLLDTQPVYAMEVFGYVSPEYEQRKTEKIRYYMNVGQALWKWEPRSYQDAIPAFPSST